MAIKKINNISKVINNLGKSVEKSLDDIGITGVATIQTNTPVRKIKGGTLKRSWTFKKANSGKKYSITFGTSINYAMYVEFKPNKSQGFFRRAMGDVQEDAKKIIKRNLSQI